MVQDCSCSVCRKEFLSFPYGIVPYFLCDDHVIGGCDVLCLFIRHLSFVVCPVLSLTYLVHCLSYIFFCRRRWRRRLHFWLLLSHCRLYAPSVTAAALPPLCRHLTVATAFAAIAACCRLCCLLLPSLAVAAAASWMRQQEQDNNKQQDDK